MKKIYFIVLFVCIFSFTICAEEIDADKLYNEQYELSGAEEMHDSLSPETKEILNNFNIDPKDSSSISDNLTTKNVFKMIKDFIISGGTKPLKSGVAILVVIILCSLIDGIGNGLERKGFEGIYTYISILSIAAIVLLPLFNSILTSVNAIKGCGVFMLSFVPVYCGILIVNGRPSTGMGFQVLLISAAEIVVQFASYVITPIIGMYLAINLSSSVSPLIKTNKLAEGFKKVSGFMMAFMMIIFVGILGIQTTVNSASDNIALKTSKFFVGSFVPVVGSVLGDALATVQGCVGLLKSTVGIYGIIVLASILLPIIVELLIWRIVVIANGAAAEMLSLQKVCDFLKAMDATLSMIIAILLCIGVLFIISLTVVSLAGGNV